MNNRMAEENKQPEFKDESQMTPEELKALQESEDFITNFKEEDFADPDKTEELRKRLADAKTTVHQKRHYRGKVTELETKLKEKDTKPGEQKPGNAAPAQPAAEAKKDIDPYVKVSFRQDHPELSKEVAEVVFKHAVAFGIQPEEALKDPIVQKYVKENQNKNDVEDASIAPGNRSQTDLGKKDWSKATEAEIVAQRNKILQGQ